MWERDAFSREIRDLNNVSYEAPYQPGIFSQCYKSLQPEIRDVVDQKTNEKFQTETGITTKLPPFSQASEKERDLIRKWLRVRDRVIESEIHYLCPDKAPRHIPKPPDLVQPIPSPGNDPIITMKNMYEFEAIGGRTLSSHNHLLSSKTLKDRMGFQLKQIKIEFRNEKPSLDYIQQLRKKSRVTGIEVENWWDMHRYMFTATRWSNQEIMLKAINTKITGEKGFVSRFLTNTEFLHLAYRGKTPDFLGEKLGDGVFYDPLNQSIDWKDYLYDASIGIRRTNKHKFGWYIEYAYPFDSHLLDERGGKK